jgi:hypothetical protein
VDGTNVNPTQSSPDNSMVEQSDESEIIIKATGYRWVILAIYIGLNGVISLG